jgi:hypothetical protein
MFTVPFQIWVKKERHKHKRKNKARKKAIKNAGNK